MAKTPRPRLNEIVASIDNGKVPFIEREKVSAPFTTVQNRALVDYSLKCIMGVERVHTNSLKLLNKEFGPNGETVYGSDNEDSRIRFVGEWFVPFTNSGMYPQTDEINSYVEITFYGTGLNYLSLVDTGRDERVTVDGGSEGGNVRSGETTSILQNRQYKVSNKINAASGLALGWHTVRIRAAAAVAFRFYGFEVINSASQITVGSGKAFGNGFEYDVTSDQLIDYNLGFDNVLDANVGTTGGRAIVYIDPEDNQVKKRLNPVGIDPQYLSNSDHSNEVAYRVINFREFGRDRGDDFSTLTNSVSDRAFTLDDGVTTLIGNDVAVDINIADGSPFRPAGAVGTAYFTLTFVGTGLDIFTTRNEASISNQEHQVEVDGAIINATTTELSGEPRWVSICSGLPYGTHTVKVIRGNAAGSVAGFTDFKIYQSKKPDLPEGAVELADYNLLADFSHNTTTDNDYISRGVVRKDASREIKNKNGTWQVSLDMNHIGGQQVLETALGSGTELSFSFFGTGFDYRFFTNTSHAGDVTISLNGTTMTAANFPTAVFSAAGPGISYNSGTASLDAQGSGTQEGCSFAVNDLPLDHYEVVMVKNDSSTQFRAEVMDIITPIHFPHTTFGSLSLKDCRNFDSNKDINREAKERLTSDINIDGNNDHIRNSFNISQVYKAGTSEYIVYFEEPLNSRNRYTVLTGGTTGNQEYINFFQFISSDTAYTRFAYGLVTYNAVSGAQSARKYVSASTLSKLQKEDLED